MSRSLEVREFRELSKYFKEEGQEYIQLLDEALQREVVKGNLAPAAVVVLAKAIQEADLGSRMVILGAAAETLFLIDRNHIQQVNWSLGILQATRQQRLEEALITEHAVVELEGETLPETLEGLLTTGVIGASDSLTVPILVRALRLAPSDQKILAFAECLATLKMRSPVSRLPRSVALLFRYLVMGGQGK